QDIRSWFRRSISSDFAVRCASLEHIDPLNFSMPPMPRELGEQLRRLEGVAEVRQSSGVVSYAEGHWFIIIARTFAADRPLSLALQRGDEATVLAGLLQGQVVLGTYLAQQTGLSVGDEITLSTRLGSQRLRIAGITKEYAALGMALFIDWATADHLFTLPG